LIKLVDLRAVIAGVVIALLLGLGEGAWVAHKVDLGDYRDLELKVANAESAANKAAEKKAEADRKAGDAIAARDAADSRLAQYQFNQIRKENTYVEITARAYGVPSVPLPAGWVRQYNAALSAGAGQAPAPAGGTDGAPTGAGAAESPEAIAAPSGIDQWDVLDNATDNAEGYAACRRKLNRLIDWVEATTE
jgi:hypothetical protein